MRPVLARRFLRDTTSAKSPRPSQRHTWASGSGKRCRVPLQCTATSNPSAFPNKLPTQPGGKCYPILCKTRPNDQTKGEERMCKHQDGNCVRRTVSGFHRDACRAPISVLCTASKVDFVRQIVNRNHHDHCRASRRTQRQEGHPGPPRTWRKVAVICSEYCRN